MRARQQPFTLHATGVDTHTHTQPCLTFYHARLFSFEDIQNFRASHISAVTRWDCGGFESWLDRFSGPTLEAWGDRLTLSWDLSKATLIFKVVLVGLDRVGLGEAFRSATSKLCQNNYIVWRFIFFSSVLLFFF